MKCKKVNHKALRNRKVHNNNNNKAHKIHPIINIKNSKINTKIRTIHLQTLNPIKMSLTLSIKITHQTQINTLIIIKIHHLNLPNLKTILFNHLKNNISTLSKKTLIKKMKKVSITSNRE